jgi:hypothetical protein
MIKIRKLAGITNQSETATFETTSQFIAQRTEGTRCSLLAVCGPAAASYTPTDRWKEIAGGYHWRYFVEGTAETAWISLPSGNYDGEQTTTLKAISQNPDAKIVYTLDGSTPTASSTMVASGTTITGAPLKTGNIVRVYFTADITGSNTSTGLTLNYNGVNKSVKVPKNGTLANFVASDLGGSPTVYKYLQAHTTLELLYDGSQFIIIGNPLVLSGSGYEIHADGMGKVNSVTASNMNSVTSNAVNAAIATASNHKVDVYVRNETYEATSTGWKGMCFIFPKNGKYLAEIYRNLDRSTNIQVNDSGTLVNYQTIGSANLRYAIIDVPNTGTREVRVALSAFVNESYDITLKLTQLSHN